MQTGILLSFLLLSKPLGICSLGMNQDSTKALTGESLQDLSASRVEGECVAAAPSTRRKLAFWLIAGMLSVVCVEVPAGSTMFPFFTIWGLLVVWPLYLLHSIFLAGVVFRFGRPRFWLLYSAGMLYGMYEAYITKVVWTSFRAEGPFFRAGGIALFETIICALFLHPLLAFVVPLYLTEVFLTRSQEVFQGFPKRLRRSVQARPMRWAMGMMTMFGLMQFVNSPSVAASLLSGVGNGLVIGLAVFWWRRSGGTSYSLRALLPAAKGLKIFGVVLLCWYLFWGFAIKPKSIPPVWPGQLTVWVIYFVMLAIFYGCLLNVKTEQELASSEPGISFGWRGFWWCVGAGTAVTVAARCFLHNFLLIQIAIFFTFYVVAGLCLLAGAALYGFSGLKLGRR